ncbi:MAG: MFS transporter [Anaerolineae bacterium]
MIAIVKRWPRFVFMMLVVEFLDEFAYSALETARPLLRDDFGLGYAQRGLITTLPVLVAILVEPAAGLFADTHRRRALIVGGGVLFGLGLVVQGMAPSFGVFMLGATLQAPASGVFVNLAQASLMDAAPTRREHRMALWTVSGSLAVVTGPLLQGAALALGIGWRPFFVGSGLLAVIAALGIARLPPNRALRTARDADAEEPVTLRQSLRAAFRLLRRGDVWRWLVLLEFSDLMLDVLFGLLARYLVDVVGVTQARAALAIAVWTGIGLLGDFLLVGLLESVKGVAYLRVSALVMLALYPAFLLVEPFGIKVVLLGLIGLFNAGWYAILQGSLYDALGDQSGAVLIVGNAAGIGGALLPLGLGIVAQTAGLPLAMGLLLAGPGALAVGLPRRA